MEIYIKFIIKNFLKSLFFVSSIIFCFIFILNLLTEFDFFRELEIKYYFPIYLSLLNSPSLMFEMFPFIFLISSQLSFINLMKNYQIQTFKYSGLKNSKIIFVIFSTSFITGLIVICLFYNLSSNLKNIYLELKNNYTSDDKYLAVITNNGLWIKDSTNENFNIVNASKIQGKYLVEASITELDKEFNVKKHIESEKIDISSNKWIIFNPTIYLGSEKSKFKSIEFNSNFDFKRIQSLFSNLASLSILELFKLKKNYNLLNLSITEINLQIYKIIFYPIYLSLMTLLASIIMFYFKNYQSNTFKISIGLFFSVIIYYMNNFFFIMGKTEKMNVILSISIPILILIIINSIYIIKINDK